jgi:hypothetical protein
MVIPYRSRQTISAKYFLQFMTNVLSFQQLDLKVQENQLYSTLCLVVSLMLAKDDAQEDCMEPILE